MKFNKLLPFVLVASGLLALSACSTPKTSGEDGGLTANNGSDAETTGLGQNGRFGGGRGLDNRTYYFAFDKSDIQDNDKAAIIANANYLTAHTDKKILVEGHTDPMGSREYNVGLGERRANAVVELLKSHGVNQDQISQVSYGAQRLAVAGHTESDYQLDRRAIIVIQ